MHTFIYGLVRQSACKILACPVLYVMEVENFDSIYNSYADSIFRYVVYRIHKREEALDIVQEVFVRFWNSYVKTGREIEAPRALLYKIAHNLVVNFYERHKTHYSLDEMTEDGREIADEAGHDRIIDESEKRILSEYVEALKPDDRQIIHLRFYEEMSIKEIADILDKNESAISVRIHRIIRTLKQTYG